MDQSLILPGTDQHPLTVELLTEDELANISGGLGPWAIGAALVGGMLGAAVGGVAVGVAIYYITRDE